MISPTYFALAIEKTSNADARAALARLESLAAELATLEREWPTRVKAGKERRGEPPVKLSKNQRLTIAGFDEDLEASEREQLKVLKDVPSAAEVVEILSFTMPGVPLDWSMLLAHVHADERPALEDIIARQRALRDAMRRYLEQHGAADRA